MNSTSTPCLQDIRGIPISPAIPLPKKQPVRENKDFPETPLPGRVGLHYYADTLHFCDADLQAWLPHLKALGTSWLFLDSNLTRAIPEPFLRDLLSAGIQPVLNFRASLDPVDPAPSIRESLTLLEAYAKWGVRHVILFDRPNACAVWPPAGWAQQDLVERFLDRFVPLADGARQAGLSPIFPALEPGGSYWDTAFLRTALTTLLRRKQEALLASMSLSAYAWTHSRSLNWGAYGPENWPTARPYYTPADSQDQKGFRIFDWYRAITQSVLGSTQPVFLLQAGAPGDMRTSQTIDENELSQTILNVARLLNSESVPDPLTPEKMLNPIPNEVAAAFFWLPGMPVGAPFQKTSAGLRSWAAQTAIKSAPSAATARMPHPIPHYLLLPTYDWGISDWHLEAIRPFIRKYRPTVGFSTKEAALAARVTVIGTESEYSEDTLQQLRQSGCQVERITADGTNLATVLAER